MSETLHVLSMRAHQKGLELINQVMPDVPDEVIGDPGRLRQILINLISNAIKFTESGEVAVRVETEGHAEHSTTLRFSVRDTGIGIPRETQKDIFKPFTQADTSTARLYHGTGLGLAIATQLVELMGGRMWLESKPGQGSTFSFTTQLRHGDRKPENQRSLHSRTLHGRSALVIANNATTREVLSSILECFGMRVVSANGGHSGLAALDRAKEAGDLYDYVLVDAALPGLGGFSVAERIKENPSWRECSVVLLTTADQRNTAQQLAERGIARFVAKPFSESDIIRVLAQPPYPAAGDSPVDASADGTAGGRHKRNLHILLAEDNILNQKLATRLLERAGHTVTVANNGKEAIEILEKETFDFVLMDVQMPVMDGLHATAAIREKERTSGGHIPIVAMTAHAMKGDRERCLVSGMDAYVPKPFKPDELIKAIDSAFRPSGAL
jgi:CheY-like chemotaxis protein